SIRTQTCLLLVNVNHGEQKVSLLRNNMCVFQYGMWRSVFSQLHRTLSWLQSEGSAFLSRYYLCVADGVPSSSPVPCSSGQFFEEGLQKCVDPYPCFAGCPLVGCHLTCTHVGDILADVNSCSAYHICDLNGPIESHFCEPPQPYFDQVNKICSSLSTGCCQHTCQPYCDPSVLFVPDPLDCTKFYVCDNGEPVFPSISCAPGENFDIGRGLCSITAECTVLCSTGGTPGPPPDECLSNFQCPDNGFFPKCPNCDPRYFYCDRQGQTAAEKECSGGLLFNPDPSYPYCLDPNSCPYP
ncbi:hypothetical protein SK128_005375, partial [Halocaridina rubra]